MLSSESGTVVRRTSIGGQAVLEGLMMMGPDKSVLAVRKPDDTITLEPMPSGQSKALLSGVPFFRGSVRLFHQMIIGVKALLRSADLQEEAEEVPADDGSPESAQPAGTEKSGKGGASNVSIYLSVVIGILLGVGLFMLLPNLITLLIVRFTALEDMKGFGATVLKNLIEGVFRIALFIGYVALTSMQKDIRRVWMYHGAEHKTIACYESGLPLTVENIRLFSTRHPRCGTAFLFVVMLVSILMFAFAGWHSGIVNLLVRLALVPVVAGVAFEIIRWSGRHDNLISRWIAKPGLAMQRLTTKEPDDDMLEVAILAMQAVVPDTPDKDEW